MKRYILCFVTICIMLTACNSSRSSRMPEGKDFVRLQAEQAFDNDGIRVIRVTKTLSKGKRGEITIQGKAGTIYKITSTYIVNNKTLTADQSRKSGKDGIVTWTWRVDEGTQPGVYPITITDGNTTVLSSFEVTE